jgi:hypothetical protein
MLAAIAMVSSAMAIRAVAQPTPASGPQISVPIVSTDETVKKTLLELDRILDENPMFEEVLRNNIDRLNEEEFRKSNPEIDLLLQQKPEIVPALKVERHFLIHRYIVRRARGPLLRPDIVALDEFLAAHTDIRRVLDRDPSQIVEESFLDAHPSLGEFFTGHPDLSTILLEKQSHKSAPKSQ